MRSPATLASQSSPTLASKSFANGRRIMDLMKLQTTPKTSRTSLSSDSFVVVNDTHENVSTTPHQLAGQNPALGITPAPYPPVSQVMAPYPSVSQVMANLPPTQEDLPNKVVQLQQELVLTKLNLTKEMENVAESRNKLIGLAAEANELQAVVDKYKNSLLLHESRIKYLTEENDIFKADLATKDEKLKEAVEKVNVASKPDLRTNSLDTRGETIYFRGFRNPLSAFFPCKLEPREGVGAGLHFKSAEHLYQFRRMMAHKKELVAAQVKKATTAARAKSISESAVPPNKTDDYWINASKAEMASISRLKFGQCHEFRQALLDTGSASLVHNMESDERWGFGRRGLGENWMGLVLEEVRSWAISNPIASDNTESPPLNASAPSFNPGINDRTASVNPEARRIVIISDSMLKGIEKHFEKK